MFTNNDLAAKQCRADQLQGIGIGARGLGGPSMRDHMNQCGPAETERSKEIPSSLIELEGAISYMAARIEVLEQMLMPVLSNIPNAGCVKQDAPIPYTSSIACAVFESTRRTRDVVDRINTIISNLEV